MKKCRRCDTIYDVFVNKVVGMSMDECPVCGSTDTKPFLDLYVLPMGGW